ncbi:MAG TPA: energy transducer TonB [Vicinamibacteria bacterium]|nr:energy transducer TonB [Vicinamibacteria bacterium]
MSAAPVFPPPLQTPSRATARPDLAAPRFEFLLRTDPEEAARRRKATVTASLLFHVLGVGGLILIPLAFFDPALPEVGDAVRAFFVMPQEAPPPPPPPPPPAAAARVARPTVAPQATPPPSAFIAPIEVPTEIKLESTLDLGVEGGVPGGVEGGVPGGVLGGVVGGLPAAPPPPAKVVRIGGQVVAPKIVRRVEPTYPPLAVQARAQAIIILEAHVDTVGKVKEVTVLRGSPLFDDAAREAVRQWRYQPLLLNGVPTEFLLTVTLFFKIQNAPEAH